MNVIYPLSGWMVGNSETKLSDVPANYAETLKFVSTVLNMFGPEKLAARQSCKYVLVIRGDTTDIATGLSQKLRINCPTTLVIVTQILFGNDI
jgi:hypothetical protein